jgi:hypothetical protein
MQPANVPAVLIAIALAAACLAGSGLLSVGAAQGPERVSPVKSPTETALSGVRAWGERFAETAAWASEHVVEAGKKTPLLVAVLSAVLLLPAVALVSFVLQSRARRRLERAASAAAETRAGIAEASGESPEGGTAPLWAQQAWLSLEGSETVALAGQIIRIGRGHENDIRLPDASVHRYHAVIEHTADEAFVITDLSGKDGNGIRVNGKKLDRAELVDGDLIELGKTKLRFESVPV